MLLYTSAYINKTVNSHLNYKLEYIFKIILSELKLFKNIGKFKQKIGLLCSDEQIPSKNLRSSVMYNPPPPTEQSSKFLMDHIRNG